MTEEQGLRIAALAAIIASIPYIKQIICSLLGDDEDGRKSWRYAIGKVAGRAAGRLRKSLLRR